MESNNCETDLSEKECALLMGALIKCHLLHTWVKAGLKVELTSKNFNFPDLTDDEEMEIVEKIYRISQLAYLKEHKNE